MGSTNESGLGDKNKDDVRPKPKLLPKPKESSSLTSSLPGLDHHQSAPSTTSPPAVGPVPSKTRLSTGVPDPPLHKKRSSTTPPESRPPQRNSSSPPLPRPVPVVKVVGVAPPIKSKPTRRHDEVVLKPVPNSRPRVAEVAVVSKDKLLERLQSMAQANDYYSLMGVTADASREDLSRARRELTAKLHPDHFTGDPEQQTR